MHVLPGRIRIEAPWVKGSAEKARAMESYLTLLDNSVKATVNPRTSRCLVFFDEKKIDGSKIVESIQEYCNTRTPVHPKNAGCERFNKNNLLSKNEPEDRIISGQLKQFLAGGALLTLFWSMPPRGPVLSPGLAPAASAALVSAGMPYFKSGLQHLKYRRKVNYDLIVSIISAVSALTGQGFWGLATLWLANLSELAQKYALLKATNAFSNSLINKGNRIYKVQQDKLHPVLPGDVVPGDSVYFKSGDCVPVDGEVISGRASVIPGEDVLPGSLLSSGTRIENGSIVVRVSRVLGDTSLARLVNILEDAVTKPDISNDLAIAFAERMLPFTVLTTMGVWAITGNLLQAISVLLAGAPGAAGLAAPTAVSAAVSTAAALGIAVKETEALENLGHLDVVVFNSHESSDQYSKRGYLALKRLEEEGYRVEKFDLNNITIGGNTLDKTGQVISMEKSFIRQMQKNRLDVAWVSGPDNPVIIDEADVNILMLTGKEEKIYPAEILCYGNDPRQVYRAIHIGRKTLRTVRQNVYLVQGINITGQVLGVLGIVKGLPTVIINLAGILAVVFNSARSLFWSGWALENVINNGGAINGLKEERRNCLFSNGSKYEKKRNKVRG